MLPVNSPTETAPLRPEPASRTWFDTFVDWGVYIKGTVKNPRVRAGVNASVYALASSLLTAVSAIGFLPHFYAAMHEDGICEVEETVGLTSDDTLQQIILWATYVITPIQILVTGISFYRRSLKSDGLVEDESKESCSALLQAGSWGVTVWRTVVYPLSLFNLIVSLTGLPIGMVMAVYFSVTQFPGQARNIVEPFVRRLFNIENNNIRRFHALNFALGYAAVQFGIYFNTLDAFFRNVGLKPMRLICYFVNRGSVSDQFWLGFNTAINLNLFFVTAKVYYLELYRLMSPEEPEFKLGYQPALIRRLSGYRITGVFGKVFIMKSAMVQMIILSGLSKPAVVSGIIAAFFIMPPNFWAQLPLFEMSDEEIAAEDEQFRRGRCASYCGLFGECSERLTDYRVRWRLERSADRGLLDPATALIVSPTRDLGDSLSSNEGTMLGNRQKGRPYSMYGTI